MTHEFLRVLNQVHSDLDMVWPDGREASCCSNDGRHYALKGYPRPVSIGQVEARLLYNLVVAGQIRRAFEVGTGFGYSSFWLGAAIARNDAAQGWLGSLDDASEGGLGGAGLEFARATSARMGLSGVVNYFKGRSPNAISSVLSSQLDLGLIDGNHQDEQPHADYVALREYLLEARFLIWHDVMPTYGVGRGLATAIEDGWSPIVFPTSCRLCVCYRRSEDWDVALRAFGQARMLALL